MTRHDSGREQAQKASHDLRSSTGAAVVGASAGAQDLRHGEIAVQRPHDRLRQFGAIVRLRQVARIVRIGQIAQLQQHRGHVGRLQHGEAGEPAVPLAPAASPRASSSAIMSANAMDLLLVSRCARSIRIVATTASCCDRSAPVRMSALFSWPANLRRLGVRRLSPRGCRSRRRAARRAAGCRHGAR